MKFFVKGDRSAGQYFAKGIRTSAAHYFSKAVPEIMLPRGQSNGQDAARAKHYLEKPRPNDL